MDPLSCLSIATSITSFVDFGAKLISLYVEVRNSEHGRSAALSALEIESRQLSGSATTARDKISTLRTRYPEQYEALDRLTTECVQAEKELQVLTDSLTKNDNHGLRGGAQALVVSFRTMLKQKDMDSLQDRLRRIREQTMMTVLNCILQHVIEPAGKLKSGDDGPKGVLNCLDRDSIRATINDLQPEFRRISSRRRPLATDTKRNKIAEGLWTSIATADRADAGSSVGLVKQLTESDDKFCNRIIKSLEFENMKSREEQIGDRFPETFQWLLDGEGSLESGSGNPLKAEKRPLTKFTAWLQSTRSDGAASPYWITGKAASGKSTLMKFICTSPQVQEHLRTWSGESQLLVCSVYFWNPGSSGQKSQVGLLRTILHQLLSQRPDLCRNVALRRYLYFQIAGLESNDPPSWTLRELQESVIRFISQLENTSRLALFIDGLDEYEANLENLVTYLKRLHDNYNVIKLCISSRPWNLFKDAFFTYPSLTMELLTKPDIEKYVYSRIGTSRALQELRTLDPASVRNLECQIIDKAEGVFLWVVLVTEKVIDTARDNNDLVKNWRIFNSLPPGLEELYDSMLGRLEPDLREMASRMYQLLFRWNSILDRPFGILEFWVATSYHDSTPQPLQDFPTNDKITQILPLVERALSGATGGILQVQISAEVEPTVDSYATASSQPTQPPRPPLMTVGFLHRTVFEWLQKILPSIISNGPPNFDPILVLTSVLVSRLNRRIAGKNDINSETEYYASHIKEVFVVGQFCQDSPESRAKLLTIINHLQIWNRQAIGEIHLAPAHRNVLSSSYPDSNVRSFLAVIFLCAPYLQAQLEPPCTSIAGLEMPWVVHAMPWFFWGKPRTQLVSTILDKLFDAARTQRLQVLNTALIIFEILVRGRFVPPGVLKTSFETRVKRSPRTFPNEFRRALLDGLSGKGFSDITNITISDDVVSSDDHRTPPPARKREKWIPPRTLTSFTSLRGERARYYIYHGFN